MLKNKENKFAKNLICSTFAPLGEMAEWSNAAVLKTVELARVPGVRIPFSPQQKEWSDASLFLFSETSPNARIRKKFLKTKMKRSEASFFLLQGRPRQR